MRDRVCEPVDPPVVTWFGKTGSMRVRNSQRWVLTRPNGLSVPVAIEPVQRNEKGKIRWDLLRTIPDTQRETYS